MKKLCPIGTALLLFSLAAWALAGPLLPDEERLSQRVREKSASLEELVRAGKRLSFWQRARLWLYGQELAPYFEGLEDRIRALAKSDPRSPAGVALAKQGLARAMAIARARLGQAGREEPERDWHRGLTGLIFLDQQWRKRVAERATGEITNPYDLVRLLDCLQKMQGKGPEEAARACPLEPAPAPGARKP